MQTRFGNVIIRFLLFRYLQITDTSNYYMREPHGKPDAVQHQLMGEKLLELLKVFDIPFSILDQDQDIKSTDALLEEASSCISETSLPYAL